MHDLELGLQVLVLLVHGLDVLVALQVLLDLEGHQEARQVGPLLAVLEPRRQVVDDGVDHPAVALHQSCQLKRSVCLPCCHCMSVC